MVFRTTALMSSLLGITFMVSAQAPVEDRSAPLGGDSQGIKTDIAPAPNPYAKPKPVAPKPQVSTNPFLPSDDPSHKADWLSQVNEIRGKYHKSQKQNEDQYQSTFDRLNAYGLTRLDQFRSKQSLIAASRKVTEAYQAVRHYRSTNNQNRKYFIAAYNHINADPTTRTKLVTILRKSFTTPKAQSEEKLVYLEEQMFSKLKSVYDILSNNASLWDFKDGGFIFKNSRLKAKYKNRERALNQSIRELQLHRDLAKQGA